MHFNTLELIQISEVLDQGYLDYSEGLFNIEYRYIVSKQMSNLGVKNYGSTMKWDWTASKWSPVYTKVMPAVPRKTKQMNAKTYKLHPSPILQLNLLHAHASVTILKVN